MSKKSQKYEKFRGEIVKKDNVMNESSCLLDTAERYKFMLLMIAQISTQDDIPSSPQELSERIYSFYVDDYFEIKEWKRKRDFRRYVKELVSYIKNNSAITVIRKDGKGEFFRDKTIWLFDFVDFQEDKRGLKVLYRFSRSVSEYLFQLKRKFIAYHIRNIMPMKSKHSVKLYELLKQYEKIGEKSFGIEEFREKMDLKTVLVEHDGREIVIKDDYKNFKNLKKRVIEPAVKEINEFSDIEITDVEYIKRGRGGKVVYITFKFRPGINFDFKEAARIKEKAEKDKKEILERSGTELSPAMQAVWESIGEVRKHHKKAIRDILAGSKNQLSENEVLFLLINADRSKYDEETIISIIKKALNNPGLTNPMGYLIKNLGIDMKTARFKELTLTSRKIDEEMFRKRLEDMFVEGKPAIEYLRAYWKEHIRPAYEEGRLDRSTVQLLKEPFKHAVIDEIENVIYLPAPDEVYKEWLESNFLTDIERFLKERFDIDGVRVEVVQEEPEDDIWTSILENIDMDLQDKNLLKTYGSAEDNDSEIIINIDPEVKEVFMKYSYEIQKAAMDLLGKPAFVMFTL
ncbi:RepB family plasmid replication initiator protein [Persephonella sp.]